MLPSPVPPLPVENLSAVHPSPISIPAVTAKCSASSNGEPWGSVNAAMCRNSSVSPRPVRRRVGGLSLLYRQDAGVTGRAADVTGGLRKGGADLNPLPVQAGRTLGIRPIKKPKADTEAGKGVTGARGATGIAARARAWPGWQWHVAGWPWSVAGFVAFGLGEKEHLGALPVDPFAASNATWQVTSPRSRASRQFRTGTPLP